MLNIDILARLSLPSPPSLLLPVMKCQARYIVILFYFHRENTGFHFLRHVPEYHRRCSLFCTWKSPKAK